MVGSSPVARSNQAATAPKDAVMLMGRKLGCFAPLPKLGSFAPLPPTPSRKGRGSLVSARMRSSEPGGIAFG